MAFLAILYQTLFLQIFLKMRSIFYPNKKTGSPFLLILQAGPIGELIISGVVLAALGTVAIGRMHKRPVLAVPAKVDESGLSVADSEFVRKTAHDVQSAMLNRPEPRKATTSASTARARFSW